MNTLNSLTNLENVRLSLEKLDLKKNITIIFDCDRTITKEDTTIRFCDNAKVSFFEIKDIFKKYDYTFEGFYEVSKFYSNISKEIYEIACKQTAKDVVLYTPILDFIERNLNKVNIIFVTAGVKKIWDEVVNFHSLSNVSVIGGNNLNFDNYIIDKNAKGYVVDFLKNKNNFIISFGDSLVDYDMLTKSNFGILVVNEKRNKDVVASLEGIKNIFQISFDDFSHNTLQPISLFQLEERMKNEII
ncbi:MAG TPA: HAD hydrolase family protein [Leptospiraceae bacterium]|nr:HAD hydrolase family protein [Leptospiraceae bacterium]